MKRRLERDPADAKPWTRLGFWLSRGQEIALCLVRKWWRPVTCIGIAGGAVVNLIVIPVFRWEVPDMMAAAAYVTAATAAFAVREWGKIKGTVPGDDVPADEGDMA